MKIKRYQYFLQKDPLRLCQWCRNFLLKFPAYASGLGFTGVQVTDLLRDLQSVIYLCELALALDGERDEAHEKLDDDAFNDDETQTLEWQTITLPAVPAFPAPKRGLIRRLMKAVETIKSRPNYTRAMGEDMGIESTVTEVEVATEQTQGGALAMPGYQTLLSWKKRGFKAVALRRRKAGASGWDYLGIRTQREFLDTPPATTPNTPETWEYQLCYAMHDQPAAQWSDIFPVTTKP